MTDTFHAAYQGSRAVWINDRLFSYPQGNGAGGVLPQAARDLIKQGANPDALVIVSRDGAKVFADATLRSWAAITIEESSGDRPMRTRPFRPFSSNRGRTGGQAPFQAPQPAPAMSPYR